MQRVLNEFHAAGKPIALCCIAPVIAAKVFGDKNIKLTMGRKGSEAEWPFGGALDAAKSFGADVQEMDVSEICVDEKNNVVTTPAFMYAGKFHQIQEGVGKMVDQLAKMIK